jgi:hypothetical protein
MTDTETLNSAIRDFVDAAKRLERLGLGTSIHLSVHHCAQEPFFAADFLGSEFPSENGDPEYGHVKGQKDGYLSRRILRGSGVLFELYMDTSDREKATV